MPTTWGIAYEANGDASDFPTLAAAMADAGVVAGDTVEFRYSDAHANPVHIVTSTQTITKAVTVKGILANGRTKLFESGGVILFTVSAGATISNLTLYADPVTTGPRGVNLNTTAAVTIEKMQIYGFRLGIFTSINNSTVNVNNCMIVCGGAGIASSSATATVNAKQVTIAHHTTGFTQYSGTCSATNCLAFYCGTCFYGTWSQAYNASTDATASGTGSQASIAAATIAAIADSADYLGVSDYRLLPTSTLRDDGTDAGLTEDIDGNALSTTFPIGCSAGCYLPGNDLSKVLTTATPPGTYTPVAVGNVRVGVAVGVGGTGTLDLPAVSDVRDGVEFDAASKTGTVVLPNEVQVLDGVGFGADGTEYEGNVIIPSVDDVKGGVFFGPNGTLEGDYQATIPNAPTITWSDQEDGTGLTVSVDGDAGATNALYYKRITDENWTLATSAVGDIANFDLACATGQWLLLATSTTAGGINCVTQLASASNSDEEQAQFRVTGILSMHPSGYKRVLLERIEKPIHP